MTCTKAHNQVSARCYNIWDLSYILYTYDEPGAALEYNAGLVISLGSPIVSLRGVHNHMTHDLVVYQHPELKGIFWTYLLKRTTVATNMQIS